MLGEGVTVEIKEAGNPFYGQKGNVEEIAPGQFQRKVYWVRLDSGQLKPFHSHQIKEYKGGE